MKENPVEMYLILVVLKTGTDLESLLIQASETLMQNIILIHANTEKIKKLAVKNP